MYYAAHSFMGIDHTYDTECWRVYVFKTKKERDQWVEENEYNGSNYVAEAVTRKIAYIITGLNKAHSQACIRDNELISL